MLVAWPKYAENKEKNTKWNTKIEDYAFYGCKPGLVVWMISFRNSRRNRKLCVRQCNENVYRGKISRWEFKKNRKLCFCKLQNRV